jgi:hypothetical protein
MPLHSSNLETGLSPSLLVLGIGTVLYINYHAINKKLLAKLLIRR